MTREHLAEIRSSTLMVNLSLVCRAARKLNYCVGAA